MYVPLLQLIHWNGRQIFDQSAAFWRQHTVCREASNDVGAALLQLPVANAQGQLASLMRARQSTPTEKLLAPAVK